MVKIERGVYTARAGVILNILNIVYLELILRVTCSLPLFEAGIPGGLCMAIAAAGLLSAGACLLRGERAAWRAQVIVAALFTVWFLFCGLTYDAYKVFMPPDIILSQAGNAARDFGGNVASTIVKSLPLIALYFLPVILACILAHIRPRPSHLKARPRARLPLFLAAGAAALFLAGYLLSNCTSTLRAQYASATYDAAIKDSGAVSALICAALPSSARGGEFSSAGKESPAVLSTPEAAEDEDGGSRAAEEYGYNMMELNFAARETSNARINTLNDYIQSLTPSRQNEYTSIFKGKNLILITAEAFSKEVIDPARTPTLYRLASSGIVFSDFYQPAWGGSTSTGEYSFLTGLAPMDATVMMSSRASNMYFTMGNTLKRAGYNGFAYHNGTYTYYSRNITLPNMGYDSFIGIGNGMENGLSGGLFPESDKEMMDYTVPQYISAQPFSVYYMTISGHASYSFKPGINSMSQKNEAVTAELDYSEPVRAYLAANQELEYALESLIGQLEAAGIAEDTVIALVPDHYPYGLLPSNAWNGQKGLLEELYGSSADTCALRDHNAAFIWCGALEADEPIVVSAPTSSLDILPTLLNLFGAEFDSRLLAGRDVFSDQAGLVFWNDGCWLTERGYYDTHERAFYPAGNDGAADADADAEYVARIQSEVSDRLSLSRIIENEDYYNYLFG